MVVKVLLFFLVCVLSVATFLGYQYYRAETALVVKSQRQGESIHIESVHPLLGGFIVVSAISVKTVGYVPIATSEYLFPEGYNGIDIQIDQQLAQQHLTPGVTLRVQLHEDKNEHMLFESTDVDTVSKDFFGRPIHRFITIE